MKRALFVWEIGNGRGHVVHLRTLAEAWVLAGGVCAGFALSNGEHAHELSSAAGPVFAGPHQKRIVPDRFARGFGPAATFADFIGDCGFGSLPLLAAQVEAWRQLIAEHKPDVVVADHAPTALLAARTLGVPSVATGIAYTVPPAFLPLTPVLIPGVGEVIWPETDLCANINTILESYGCAPLDRFAALYGVEASLPCSPALLDPYADGRLDQRFMPTLPPLDGAVGEGEEVFAYLSTYDRYDAVLLAALMTCPFQVRAYLPQIEPSMASMLMSRGVVVEPAPVPPSLIAERSRVLLHAGNHGMVALGLKAGLTQVCIPQQLEQYFSALQVQRMGAGAVIEKAARHVPAVHQALQRAFADDQMKTCALDQSQKIRAEFAQDQQEALVSFWSAFM